jgi:integral membrane protein
MTAEPAARPVDRRSKGIPAALVRYRTMAWIVGVMLILLVLVAVPLKYLAGMDGPVAVIGTAHGFLYCVYLLAAFDLALRGRWTAKGTILVLLAGTVPFLSFVAERIVTRKTRAGQRV